MTGVSSAIFLSRILGFFREILTAHFLGAGVLASAWHFAFMIPNLARRAFGEGLLAQVLVPVLVQTMEKEGKERAGEKFSCIFFYLSLLLAASTLLVSGIASLVRLFMPPGSHGELAMRLIPIVMPYCIFICLIGIMTSFLNSFKSFVLPALISLFLNICLISCFLVVFPLLEKPFSLLKALGYAVIFSGVLELVLMLFLLHRKGVLPKLNGRILKDFPTLKEIGILIAPGMLGVVGYEFSVFFDKSMAMLAGPHAVPALNFSERLVYLPVGVIAVACGTVALPEMAQCIAKEKWEELRDLFSKTQHLLLYITIPLAIFIVLFSQELIRLFFMRGRFTLADAFVTSRVLMIYAVGIPAFCTLKLLVNFFLAQKDAKTPMCTSLITIGLNVILNLILLKPLGERGLALATVISAYLNNILLLWLIRRKSPLSFGKDLGCFAGKILQLSILPAAGAVFLCTLYFPGGKPEGDLARLLAGSGVFGVLYLLGSLILCRTELQAFVKKLLRR